MKENLLDLSGKIDSIRLEAIEKIANLTQSYRIRFFIIGAAARDMILSDGYGIQTIRATLDIDLGVRVPDWKQYKRLKQGLVKTGKFKENKEEHRLIYQNRLRIDLIPFGPISDSEKNIRWLPEQEIVMSVLGFEESFRHSQIVRLRSNPVLDVRVVSLAGLALMKIISWNDKYPERDRDAIDLALIIKSYAEAGNSERIFNELTDLLEKDDFDYTAAGARLLGRDIAVILTPASKKVVLEILDKETGDKMHFKLIEDMIKSNFESSGDFSNMLSLLEEMKTGIQERIS